MACFKKKQTIPLSMYWWKKRQKIVLKILSATKVVLPRLLSNLRWLWTTRAVFPFWFVGKVEQGKACWLAKSMNMRSNRMPSRRMHRLLLSTVPIMPIIRNCWQVCYSVIKKEPLQEPMRIISVWWKRGMEALFFWMKYIAYLMKVKKSYLCWWIKDAFDHWEKVPIGKAPMCGLFWLQQKI